MGDCFSQCVNKHPKINTAICGTLGLLFVILGIVLMVDVGNSCSDTSDDYYFNCDDSNDFDDYYYGWDGRGNVYFCNLFGCDEWYAIIYIYTMYSLHI